MQERLDTTDVTRQRLLYAAGEVFAELGFRAASVRKICDKANVNVALVSYYFKNKEELYQAVLDYSYHQAHAQQEQLLNDQESSPEEQLYLFIYNFMRGILDEGLPAWHGKLMAREMFEPTGALDRIVETAIRPVHKHLRGIIKKLSDGALSSNAMDRCVYSIIGQCIFYYHARPVLRLLQPKLGYDAVGIRRAAQHIYDFSLLGIKALVKHKQVTE